MQDESNNQIIEVIIKIINSIMHNIIVSKDRQYRKINRKS